MDYLSFVFFASISFILVGFVLMLYAASFMDAHQVAERIQAYIIEDRENIRSRELSRTEVNFSDSFLRRTLAPAINSFLNWLGKFTPAQSLEKTNHDLALAGISFLKAQSYFGIRMIFLLLGIVFGFYTISRNPNMDSLMVAGAAVIVMFILPVLWLRLRVVKQKEAIQKSMPDALDMLSVSTAAGLGFDQSMMKVSQFYQSAAADEFARVVSEIEVGVSRQDALRNFSKRVDISEVSSFVAVIIQSEILGMSIADVLQAQAEQMRIQRQYRVKEAAQKLPVKMMVPLALLIFPALLAVLLGPTIPAFLEIF